MTEPPVPLTYRELAARLGLGSADAARVKAKRRGWPVQPGNHPGAQALVLVPAAVLAGGPERSPGSVRGSAPPAPDPRDALVDELRRQVERERDRADRADAERLTERDRAAALVERLDAEHAARRAVEVEAERLRGRLADAEGRLADLAGRPWWARLLGR
jgi:hypothetical protein